MCIGDQEGHTNIVPKLFQGHVVPSICTKKSLLFSVQVNPQISETNTVLSYEHYYYRFMA